MPCAVSRVLIYHLLSSLTGAYRSSTCNSINLICSIYDDPVLFSICPPPKQQEIFSVGAVAHSCRRIIVNNWGTCVTSNILSTKTRCPGLKMDHDVIHKLVFGLRYYGTLRIPMRFRPDVRARALLLFTCRRLGGMLIRVRRGPQSCSR